MNKTTIVATATAILSCSAAFAEHIDYDLAPRYVDGKIVIEGLTHAIEGRQYWSGEGVRVFAYETGEGQLNKRRSSHPGFLYLDQAYHINDLGNSAATPVTVGPWGFSPTTALYLTFTDDLKYWSGSGFVPTPNGEYLDFNECIVGTGTGELDPLPVGYLTSGLHEHFYNTLYGNGGSTTPSNGIYLVEARLNTVGPETLQSDPFWMVYAYGNGLTGEALENLELQHEAAVAYVQTNYVPEPASLGMGLIGLMGLAMRRRRRSA